MARRNLIKNLVITGIILIIVFYIPVLVLPKNAILSLTNEDGPYESLTAILFLFASIVFLFIFFKRKNRNIFYLLFAIAFFFAAGEEISWGQRIFHFATPAAIEAVNAQKEFSIHNLFLFQHEHGFSGTIKSLLNFNRLFILAWGVYCLLIPIAFRYSSKVSTLLLKIRLPIVSIWIGMLFLFNEVTCKMLEIFYVSRLPYDPFVTEIKEALWGLIVFFMAIYFYSFVISKEPVLSQEVVTR